MSNNTPFWIDPSKPESVGQHFAERSHELDKENAERSCSPVCDVCGGEHRTEYCPQVDRTTKSPDGETSYHILKDNKERLGKETTHNDPLFSQKDVTDNPRCKVWVEYRDTLVRIGEVYVDPNGTNNRQLEVLLAGIIHKVKELEEQVKNLEISVGGIRN